MYHNQYLQELLAATFDPMSERQFYTEMFSGQLVQAETRIQSIELDAVLVYGNTSNDLPNHLIAILDRVREGSTASLDNYYNYVEAMQSYARQTQVKTQQKLRAGVTRAHRVGKLLEGTRREKKLFAREGRSINMN